MTMTGTKEAQEQVNREAAEFKRLLSDPPQQQMDPMKAIQEAIRHIEAARELLARTKRVNAVDDQHSSAPDESSTARA